MPYLYTWDMIKKEKEVRSQKKKKKKRLVRDMRVTLAPYMYTKDWSKRNKKKEFVR